MTTALRHAPQRPIKPEVVTLRKHVRDGRGYRTGDRYRYPLRLLGRALDAGDVRVAQTATHDWWAADGRVLQAEPGTATPYATEATPGALRILAGCGYDPGSSAYRLHSALNETTPHASAFVRWQDTNPHCSIRQLDMARDWPAVRDAVETADVLHCHIDYSLLEQAGYVVRRREGQVIVRHYHGSRWDGVSRVTEGAEEDDRVGAVVVGARLTLVADRPDRAHWLPIAIPVARYAALRRPHGTNTFRVAHSPTVRAYKGTAAFLRSCERLRSRGVPVEPVLIEGLPHAEALRVKATCDTVFDSFWLGIQGSGLEGGAMGLPVIAGDASVAALYRAEIGHVPYTFADDEHALTEALERLAVDVAWREAESARVAGYVAEYHSYAAVGARYQAILAPHVRH